MEKAIPTADLQINEINGTITITLGNFKDANGAPTGVPAGLSATYAASDAAPGPSVFTLTPSADTSSCAGSINQAAVQALDAAGAALPTGITFSVTATWDGLPLPITITAEPPVDVVPGPANTFVPVVSQP